MSNNNLNPLINLYYLYGYRVGGATFKFVMDLKKKVTFRKMTK